MGIFFKKNKDGTGGKWAIDYYDAAGKRIKRVIGNKKQAETAMASVIALKFEEKVMGIKRPKKLYFSELAEEFVKFSRIRCKPKSHEANLNALKTLVPLFGNKLLSELSLRDVEAYTMMRARSVKPSSVNRDLTVLKRMLNLAEEWGYLTQNIAKRINKLKEGPGRLRYLSRTEIEFLIKACEPNPCLKVVILVALNTGMRLGEILSLQWKQIDLENGLIHLNQTKNGKRRDLPLNQLLLYELQNYKKLSETENLFQVKSVKRPFKRALQTAGITDFRFHDLRHTFASYMVMNGVDLATVSNLLGHSSIEMTMRYSHLSLEHRKHAVERMGELFQRKTS